MSKKEQLLKAIKERKENFIYQRATAKKEWETFHERLNQLPPELLSNLPTPPNKDFTQVFPSLFLDIPDVEKYKSEVIANSEFFKALSDLEADLEFKALQILKGD